MKYHSKDLRKIIAKTVQNGFSQKIKTVQNKERIFNNDSHEIILDFFDLLEDELYQSTTDELAKKIKKQGLFSTIETIDTTIYNTETIASTLENVTQETEKNPTINAKEKLLQELLKQWKPNKKQVAN
jgi:hypothetical protein